MPKDVYRMVEMIRTRKSWREKLMDAKGLPKVVTLDAKMAKRWGFEAGDTMVIPAPVEVDEMIRKIPKGKVATLNEIREGLARKHGVKGACPLTTGIFVRISAEAAEEARRAGKKRITPYWRVLKTSGYLNEKFPGGVDPQKEMLEREGHRVVKKGQKFVVDNYESFLVRL